VLDLAAPLRGVNGGSNCRRRRLIGVDELHWCVLEAESPCPRDLCVSGGFSHRNVLRRS